jgi:hypothetical protein
MADGLLVRGVLPDPVAQVAELHRGPLRLQGLAQWSLRHAHRVQVGVVLAHDGDAPRSGDVADAAVGHASLDAVSRLHRPDEAVRRCLADPSLQEFYLFFLTLYNNNTMRLWAQVKWIRIGTFFYFI